MGVFPRATPTLRALARVDWGRRSVRVGVDQWAIAQVFRHGG